MHPLTKSLQRELDDFFQRLSGSDFQIRTVTKGALSQARSKINPSAFKELSEGAVKRFYEGTDTYTWDVYPIRVVDGSTITLPTHKAIVEEFGSHGFGPQANSPRSLARISLLYDPLNGITHDSQIDSYDTSEQTLCEKHLEHLKKGELVIFDRLYAGFDLMWKLKQRRVEFLFRMKTSWWKVVREFAEQKSDDRIVEINTSQGALKVRLVRVRSKGKEDQIFCTSVMDNKFTADDFGDLYQGRWGIEEAYKTLKNWIELENFSGKTPIAIRQDFFSKIFLMNLCAIFSHPVAEKIKKEKENYRINRTQALAMVSLFPIPLFLKPSIPDVIKAFDDIVSKTIDIFRPNRTFQRKPRIRKARFSINYKRL